MSKKKILILLDAMRSDDEKYFSEIKNHSDKTERLYRENIPVEEYRRLYVLAINQMTCRNLRRQSILNEFKNDYLDKGKAHE